MSLYKVSFVSGILMDFMIDWAVSNRFWNDLSVISIMNFHEGFKTPTIILPVGSSPERVSMISLKSIESSSRLLCANQTGISSVWEYSFRCQPDHE